MSHLHFTATEAYRKRVIQLGEAPNRVFNVGGMGIENIKRLQLLSKDAFEQAIDFKLNTKNLLVTFHPVYLRKMKLHRSNFKHCSMALDGLKDTHLIFTKNQ